MRHHASTIALNKIIKHASFVYADMPEPTFQILQRGEADLFASLHEVLRHYVARLPGSRVWEGRYGFNSLGIAVPKGQAARLAFLSEFAEHAKASGIIQQAIGRSGWSGYRIARTLACDPVSSHRTVHIATATRPTESVARTIDFCHVGSSERIRICAIAQAHASFATTTAPGSRYLSNYNGGNGGKMMGSACGIL